MQKICAVLLVLFLSACATTTSQPDDAGLRMWAERAIEGGSDDDVVIYGNGVAIWNDRRIVRIPESDVEKIRGAFRESDFEQIPAVSTRGKRLRYRAGLRTPTSHHEASQTWESPENEALRDLVDAIFAIVQPAVASGVTTSSLSDGLRAVAQGGLPPEALQLIMHVRPAGGDGGFLMRVEHGRATSARYIGDQLTPAREIDLPDATLRDLASRLAAADPATLPINLHAPGYIELIVNVLGHEKNILAREFAGMTPDRHGQDQVRFDELIAWLEARRSDWF